MMFQVKIEIVLFILNFRFSDNKFERSSKNASSLSSHAVSSGNVTTSEKLESDTEVRTHYIIYVI